MEHLLETSLANSWKRFRRRHLRPWRRVTYGDLRVHYKKHLDGGGSDFGQEYIPLLRSLGMPKQTRVFEWCSGPGFIGFSMLAHGLCESLCLADINDQAVEACRRTIRDNGLADRVSVYHSDNLKSIPSSEQWDLVVGNPPFYADDSCAWEIRLYDKDWHLHRDFYAGIGEHLKRDGVILMQEANDGSTVETFRPMIDDAGLSIAVIHGVLPGTRRVYYIGMTRRGAAPPSWLVASPEAALANLRRGASISSKGHEPSVGEL
jgi:16S rRNA G966 N2-methylase RsmD